MIAESIDDIYELSPMQRGMLFHTLYTPHSGVYIEQAIYHLQGALQPDLLRQAWQSIQQRHPVLRTLFIWEGIDEPVQVVQQIAELPWQELDWRGYSTSVQQSSLDELLANDRQRGFDMKQAPLLRISLLRLAHQEYYLLFTYHHLLLDGWSLAETLREVLITYEAYVQGKEPALQITRRPYHDYLLWLQEQDQSAAEQFWRTYLAGFVAPTPLVLQSAAETADTTSVAPQLLDQDAAANAEQTSAHARLHLSGGRSVTLQGLALSMEKTEALRQFARQHRLTINTLVQGAWSLLLSRYSGQDDILFGATVNGRPLSLPGAEDMIGLFINTLPVRVPIPAQESLLTWLTQLQMQQADMRQYDYSPLVQIQGWSDVPRELPLFESLMVFENYPLNSAEEPGTVSTLEVRAVQMLEQTNYPLVLAVGAWRRLELHLGYATTQFAGSAIARMLEHLAMLLDEFLAHPEQRLLNYSLLTEREKQSILTTWNQTAEPYPSYHNWTELFAQQVQRTPESSALCYGSEVYSYQDLEQRANQLAHYLQQQGAGPEVRIAVCLERSPDLCVSLLSCLKAGAAYFPIDPHYPPERIEFLLADAGVAIVLTRSDFQAACSYPAARTIVLDKEQAVIAEQSIESPATSIYPDNAAYLIYTSGSTGTPKGVIGTHRALVNHSQATIQRYQLDSNDRVLQFASLNFDVFLEECLPTWSIGAAVVMWPEAYPAAPSDFNRYLEQERLTIINIPSSYWHAWVAEMMHAQAHPSQMLKAVIIGSERALPAQLQNWYRCATEKVALYNAYGLTETTITALTYQAHAEEAVGQLVPVGQAIGNVQAYILDPQLQLVAIGLPGELYIGGLALARGYFQRPELTAERFVPHPFSQQEGARLYRTGDLARYLPSGAIEVMGRLDTQIKIRGFRIEPGEIESVLAQDPAVQECVVVVREDVPGESRLVAYVVARTQIQALAARLQLRIQEKLPPYMLPTICILSDQLPRTSTGKIDPRQLPAPEQQGTTNKKNYAAPETPLEEILASIWASVLQVESVGRTEHFFRLGGHSLQATQVVARLRDILQLELPVRAIYDKPTIAKLATHIEALRKPEKGLSIPAITRMERHGQVPLSFAQERFWFLNQWQPDNPFYNISLALQLHGLLDQQALERAWKLMVARHEPLRTTILSQDGVASQHISAEDPSALTTVDLTGRPASERAQVVRSLIQQEAQRPFQLDQELVRLILFQLDPNEHVLLLIFHHIIVDGWSIDLLLNELQTFYRQQQVEPAATEPEPLPLQYADYALWQRTWLQGEILETQLSYWQEQLAGAPPTLDLPTDRPRPAVQTFRGAIYPFSLNPAVSQGLQAVNREEGVTNFMALLAGFYLVFVRYAGQYDLVVGTPTAGRTQRETEQMVGLFLNTLPLRIHGDATLTWRELLGVVRDVALDAYTHQDLPFEKLVEALQPERSQSHSPLFQVLFVFQNTPHKELSWPGLQAELIEIGSRTAKQDLTIELRETAEGIRGVVEYNIDLFDENTIIRMITHFQTLLGNAIEEPDLPIGDLPLLTAGERQQMLGEWNATAHDSLPDLCLHTLFEQQVQRTPTAVAVLTEAGQLTYQELDERANQLAHYLRSRGVRPEQRVGVCLERKPELIMSLLAILKAGAAYVPFDVRLPQERIRFCLEDADIQLMLTHTALVQQLELSEEQAVCLDALQEQIAQQPRSAVQSNVSVANLAYLIYTSGSTGTPKAVAITHQSPAVLVKWAQSVFAPEDLAGVLAATSITFDLSIFEIFVPLSSGGTVILANDALHLPTLKTVQQVTLINTVPSAAVELANLQAIPETVRVINLAGEPLTLPLVQQLYQQTMVQRVFNLYGPSEDTTYSTFGLQTRDISAAPTIGRPLAHTQVYLLDAAYQPVPVGVIGEVYLGGAGLARGYLHRPELTAERFIPDLFSTEPGMRLYRTGDLARYRPNGEIEFIGRNDNQVKIRGYRIELGEIEQALLQHPDIQQCVVVVREDAAGEKYLVAYSELKAAVSSSVSSEFELRHFLRARLPEYMLPTRFEVLDALPLNANGKVDRRALPEPTERVSSLFETAIITDAALSQVEELIQSIWSQLLQRESIGLHDNFFELGGHSLLAIRIISRIRELFQLDVKLRLLFEAPTIAELARHIEELLQVSSLETSSVPALRPQERPAVIPLSFAQEAALVLESAGA
ncbi:non-ribosomal peptide synthetase [Dictyobacter vulcani]|uniref:Non-ribosomal peptide synthetase n=1 Tax=Dictyobacter vulcani TaxID=2607529 RepID=A0A5J4KL16_9CHLR|nr:non-ribosomal peptide synthetase [Dictyobacter vulcani]GER90134.1 non-ribosomal peptide synthetase [Dictyobacter vulcani]